MSTRLHKFPSRDPKIKVGSLVAPSGRRRQSEGENLEFLPVTRFPNSVVTCLEKSGPEDLGIPPDVNGRVWFTNGSRTKEGTGAGVYGQSVGIRLSISLGGKYATVFQAEIYAFLVCAYEIQTNVIPEKYVSVCCDNQASL